MCRFLAYKGSSMLMADLITRPAYSLISQSNHPREGKGALNADGFGIGWYDRTISCEPAIFTSITPAWNNRNLFNIAEKIKSKCFFAHVRGATSGYALSEINCHPFKYKNFLWMHNGDIGDFYKIKRKLRESLPDKYYDHIFGTTDSEHAFSLFLSFLGGNNQKYNKNELESAMQNTIAEIGKLKKEFKISAVNDLNFAVTDGNNLLVSRYSDDKKNEPPSLYYAEGESLLLKKNSYHIVKGKRKFAIVASEPLTKNKKEWTLVKSNHLIMIDEDSGIEMKKIAG
jgi:ergothioneine biosynthesis protein EgtC